MTFLKSLLKIALIIVAGLAIGLTVTNPSIARFWKGSQPVKWVDLPPPSEPVSIAGSPYEGDPAARIVIIEYTDFECPTCRRFAAQVLPSVRRKYIDTGVVGLVLKHFPIESLHPMAKRAALIAACADVNGQFWPVHDSLMTAPLSDGAIDDLIRAMKLDGPGFSSCLRGSGPTRVQEDLTDSRSVGVQGTPTFFIGRRRSDSRIDVVARFSGARTPSYFDQAILRLTSQ